MKRFFSVLAVAAVIASVTATAGATADEAAQVDGPIAESIDMPDVKQIVGAELSAAALEDLATMADEEGIPLAEAIDRYAWHHPFSMMVDKVRLEHPDSFAGARIEDSGPWIAFADNAPRSALAAVAQLEAELFPDEQRAVTVVEHRGFTEAGLDEALAKAHFAALGQTDLVADAASGYDIESGAITVRIEPVAALKAADAAALAADVVGRDAPALASATVEVVDAIVGSDDISIYGGHSQSSCTSGFTVNSGYYYGIAMAAHCGNNPTYTSGSTTITLSYQSQHDGWWGDFQWNRNSSHTHKDDFYSGSYHSGLRDVAGTATPTEGQRLCSNGKTSGKTCDDVYQLNHCNGNRCHLTLMHNRERAGGDSGGPWFYSNTAYGIHSGYKTWWFKKRDAFSPVTYIDEALGIVILK